MKGNQWILCDAQDLVGSLHDVCIAEKDALARIGVRHFFVSGSAEELAPDMCTFLRGHVQLSKLVQKAVTLLFAAQYIRSRMLPDLLFRVIKGSGVGLVRSSSVADARFAYRCEQNLEAELHDAGVAFYGGFRDDLLVVVRNRDSFREWL